MFIITLNTYEEWEEYAKEHDFEISEKIVKMILENLNNTKRHYHVMDIEILEEETVLEVTIDKKYFAETLKKNLKVFEEYERYEECTVIVKAIEQLESK